MRFTITNTGEFGTGDMELRLGVNDANNYAYISSVEIGISSRTLVLQETGGQIAIGRNNARSTLDIDQGTGKGQVTIDGSTGGCLMIRDTDDAGWTQCSTLNGVMTCSVDSDGICD